MSDKIREFLKFLASMLPSGVYKPARRRTPRVLDPHSPKIERAKLKRERRQCRRLIEAKSGGWINLRRSWRRTR